MKTCPTCQGSGEVAEAVPQPKREPTLGRNRVYPFFDMDLRESVIFTGVAGDIYKVKSIRGSIGYCQRLTGRRFTSFTKDGDLVVTRIA